MGRNATWGVVQEATTGLYRAELWVSPFNGRMLASTMWRKTRGWAHRDGVRVFTAFQEWCDDE